MNSWIGGQFVSMLEKEGVEYVVAKKRLGDDPDESIEEEILSVSPTHIASFIGRTHGPGSNTIDYLEGGPDKLCVTMCMDCYFWLRFAGSSTFTSLTLGVGAFSSTVMSTRSAAIHLLKRTDRTTLEVLIRLPRVTQTVSCTTTRVCSMFECDFQSLVMLVIAITSYKKILNIPNSVTVLPELLPVLLKLMKKRHTGTINLVNHGCVEHTQILEAYKEAVDPTIDYELIDENDQSEFATKLRSSRSNCTSVQIVLPTRSWRFDGQRGCYKNHWAASKTN